MVNPVLEAVGLWALIFLPGGVAGGLASKVASQDRKILSGVASQVTFTAMSLVIALTFNNGFRLLGLGYASCCVLRAILYSGLLALAIVLTTAIIFEGYRYEPPFLPRSLPEIILVALILAPFSEELMYRGVVEGYLLSHTSLFISVLVPAILFSLMHIIPYNTAPKPIQATVLVGAFLLGLIAGYYRALSGSLLPAYASHSTMNAVGILQYRLEKRIYPDKQKVTPGQ